MGCGRGLGNGSALASEFCREPLDFIEFHDQNTHEKQILANASLSIYAETLCVAISTTC